MQRITITALICFVAALEAMGQTAPDAAGHQVLKCEDLNGKACTWAQVSEIEAAAISGESTHKALDTFGKLSLAWFDGTLKCDQADGTPCSAEQVRSLTQIAAPLKLRVWYRFGGAPEKQ
jgi:hypothetical protein